MLIWFGPRSSGLCTHNGIVRAGQVQAVVSVQGLNDLAQADRQQLVAQAQTLAHTTLQEAQRTAGDTVQQARLQAQALLEQATQQYEAERERGYSEGQARAVAEWHERHASSQLQATRSLQSLDSKLADIVTTAVRRIVQSEEPQALFLRALENVRSLTRGATAMTLRVSVQDVDHARLALQAAGASPAHAPAVEVAADPSLAPGSCVFESDIGVLDASLDTQLRGLRNAMVRAVQMALAAEEAPAPRHEDPP
jgi:type III secretion protein L